MLVRVLREDVDIKQAAIISNEGGAARMSALEQAGVDAERLKDFRGFDIPESGDLNTAGNRGAIKQWVGQFPVNQQSALLTSEGYLSKEGLTRLRNAILYRAYGDSPILKRLVESTDDASANLSTALIRSAGVIADARARIAEGRLAGTEKLQRRAEAKARALLKSRISARKDIPYSKLTTSEKIQVDTAVAKKTKLIKRIAARLLPKLRKAEFERLKSYHSGEPMKSLHTVVAAEDFSGLFNDLNAKSTLELVDIIENAITKFEKEGNPISITLRRMLNSTVGTDPIIETLIKKAEKTGIPFSTLKEVFERGLSLYVNESTQTPEQIAFNRVNSYIAKGRAWTLDADLREEKIVNEELDIAFKELLEKNNMCSKEIVDRKPAESNVKKRQQEVQKKIIDEGEMKPYVKPHYGSSDPKKQTAWVASNKWGKKKYFGMDFKKSAEKHAKINEDSPSQREIGTNTLVKKYKKETPGQEKSDLNETFNMAWTAGIGVTLSAEECGIKMKPAFELHPDVVDAMEEVRSSDVEGVIVRTADGKTIVRRQKRNKKIIGSGNVNDGKPDDTL